ncbi:FG-GAP repeat domain-containing protein [Streptomyces sp. PsTaAH-124]|uniref:FG-GAP repeat domain-containing protein n=1 Tax=Streptomyces sp. PsTaAH-124 TaxID=1157638 RepID=UPI000366E592|nr:VCBS repeat-containing protein [Streptomyces sp. PsTaAH-124]
MFLSTPALAADKPSQDVSIPAPKAKTPKGDRPQADPRARSLRAGTKAVAASLDLDGDKIGDNLVRLDDGTVLAWLSSTNDFTPYTIDTATPDEKQKDIITPGNLDGSGGDEVLTLSTTGTLSLYQSNGADGTGPALWSGQGWQIYNKVFAPGDVTGDGKPDLLARTYSGDLYLYQGTGSDSSPFRARVLVGSGWSMFDQLVGVGDMNKDGIGDVVARTPSGDLYFYAGKGSATAPLATRTKIGSGWNTYNQIIAAGDWNGDGLGDLLGRTASGDLYSYYADGSGNFAARQKNGSGFEPVDLFAGSGANPYWGKSSLIGLDNAGTLFWYGAQHNGQFSARSQISDTGGWAGAQIGYASSLDPDGYADLLESYSGTLYNYGAGADDALATGWSNYKLFIGPGDLNDDGKGDLLARDGSGNLYLFRGNGTGASVASPIKIGGGWNAYDKIVGAGDLTGDGRADVLARTPSGTLYLYRGTGNSTSPFAAKVKIGDGWQQYNKLASPGDLDGDNNADLVAVNAKGELYRYGSTGQGQFKARVKLGTGWNTYKNLY